MLKKKFTGWENVSKKLKAMALSSEDAFPLNEGQRSSLKVISERIKNNGIIIADEVGMGKTRIAVSIAKAVVECGGRVAVLIPPGLGYQWQSEFTAFGLNDINQPTRSLTAYFYNKENKYPTQPVLLISHLFSNWRIKKTAKGGRLAIIAELHALARKKCGTRRPKNFESLSRTYSDAYIQRKAEEILQLAPEKIIKQIRDLKWSEEMLEGENFSREDTNRKLFERVIGIGFGYFDLVITDEAHKNRADDSSLSRLLRDIICINNNHRSLSLTATPLELSAENWLGSLKRIEAKGEFETIIGEFSDSVKLIRKDWRLDENARKSFVKHSKLLKVALRPFVIRRDKREDEHVKLFEAKTGEPYHQYRKYTELKINPSHADFPKTWRRVLCAAESLAFVADLKEDLVSKRARLTVANGHSIGAWIDAANSKEELGFDDTVNISSILNEEKNSTNLSKKKARQLFWKNKLQTIIHHKSQSLYDHPNILVAIKFIETNYTDKRRKILVFGKFKRPIKAFSELLNAREIVRRYKRSEFWPQFKLSPEEKIAVKSAIKQLHYDFEEFEINSMLRSIEEFLDKGKYKIEKSRKQFRATYFERLGNEFDIKKEKNSLAFKIFDRIRDNHLKANSETEENDNLFHSLTRACYELSYGSDFLEDGDSTHTGSLLDKFLDILKSCLDTDVFEDVDLNPDADKIDNYIDDLDNFLASEYSIKSSRFSKILNGDTTHGSRRLIQLAFNRANSFPFVLVAQSQVGREGLNLHEACHTVMMLHPEWNPAVAEQQIGRVDRINGLWSKLLKEHNGNAESCPRIEIIPVIFEHTYDEQNWNVLMDRWRDLKAHLHGIIIDEQSAFDEAELTLIKEINSKAPDFRPDI